MTPSDQQIGFVDNANIQYCDVLLGRGAHCARHVGSLAFKVVVASKLEAYILASSRKKKTMITLEAVKVVQVAGGRFLTRIVSANNSTTLGDNDCWHEVSEKEARIKVREQFRDCIKSTHREGFASVLLYKLGLTSLFSAEVLPFFEIVQHVMHSSAACSARKHIAGGRNIEKKASGGYRCNNIEDSKSFSINISSDRVTSPIVTPTKSPLRSTNNNDTVLLQSFLEDHAIASQVNMLPLCNQSDIYPTLCNWHDARSLPLSTFDFSFLLEDKEPSQKNVNDSCCNNETGWKQRMQTVLDHESKMCFDLNEHDFDLILKSPNSTENNASESLSSFLFSNEHDNGKMPTCEAAIEEAIRISREDANDDVWNGSFISKLVPV